MTIFSGAVCTPLLPFATNSTFQFDRFDPFVAWQVANGVKGFFALGTWGGFALLTTAERKTAAEQIVAAIHRHGGTVMLQIGALAQSEAEDLARHAAAVGADAIASVVPLYYSSAGYYSFEDYKAYFARLVEVSDLPLYLYNNKRTTNVLLTPEQFVELVGVGLAGVKDGSKDPGWILKTQELLAQQGLQADIVPGNTSAMPYSVAYGIGSCMSGATVTMPRLTAQTMEAFLRGDMAEAGALHRKLMSARRRIAERGHPAPTSYAVLRAMGHDLGVARRPWPHVSDHAITGLIDELKALGVPDVL
ncbi:4-hydroxy-tetrahydrodipicolinate synthase [Magnetospira thiophila]